MHRLLQGDVGSGKTIVALFAALLAMENGYQAAVMAPTELLAEQHARTMGAMLEPLGIRPVLVTGRLGARERREADERLRGAEPLLAIGTHALVQESTRFAKLGFVAIDEQHRFGVEQRAALGAKGARPDVLLMSATPIPRSLALTLYGDLDVSSIRDQPPGRQPVHTYLAKQEQRAKWWEFFRKKLREGRQGYIVVPRVSRSAAAAPAEDDDNEEATSPADLETTFEELVNGELADFQLDLVHGRMSAAEKEAAMAAFRSGRTQALVATSVIEVGIDVPNATIMTIFDAQRFGLAQLHQLRGRIRRGGHTGYCCLLADTEDEESLRRLQAVVETSDGFELAEIDFQLRGPGDLLGTRQSGLPPLRIADLAADKLVMEEARRDAQALLVADPGFASVDHARLRRMVLARYGKALGLGDVG